MAKFWQLPLGALFTFNGYSWRKDEEAGARLLPDDIAYPFPLDARVKPA